MDKYKIVPVVLKDLELLQEISRRTFAEIFTVDNSEEDMRKYLDENFSTDKMLDELSNANSSFFFASINDTVVGYLKLNFADAQTELQGDNAMEIQRIYILKEFQGCGMGQLLFNKALEVASANDVEYVWLGVWENNHKAIKFYEKNGFVPFDKHIFRLGNEEQIDIMMKLKF